MPSPPKIFQLDLPEEYQLISNHIHTTRYPKENKVPRRKNSPREKRFLKSQITCSSIISFEP